MNNNLTELSTTEAIKAESQRHSSLEETILMCRSLILDLETIFEALRKTTNKNSLVYKLAGIGKYISGNHEGMVDGMLESFKSRTIALNDENITMGERRNHILVSLDEIKICYESIEGIKAVFGVIHDISTKHFQNNGLANVGLYLAVERMNEIDCIREDIERACGFRKVRSVA